MADLDNAEDAGVINTDGLETFLKLDTNGDVMLDEEEIAPYTGYLQDGPFAQVPEPSAEVLEGGVTLEEFQDYRTAAREAGAGLDVEIADAVVPALDDLAAPMSNRVVETPEVEGYDR